METCVCKSVQNGWYTFLNLAGLITTSKHLTVFSAAASLREEAWLDTADQDHGKIVV